MGAAQQPTLKRGREGIERGLVVAQLPAEGIDLLLEETVLLGKDFSGLRQEAARRGAEGVNRGQNHLAQTVAGEPGVGVARISQRSDGLQCQVTLDLPPVDPEHRAGEVAGAMPHSGEATSAAPAQEMEQEGFHLVVAGVPERDRAATGFRGDPPEKCVAGIPPSRLRPRQTSSRAPADEIKPPALGHAFDETGVGRAFRPPGVVEMRHGQAKWEGRE